MRSANAAYLGRRSRAGDAHNHHCFAGGRVVDVVNFLREKKRAPYASSSPSIAALVCARASPPVPPCANGASVQMMFGAEDDAPAASPASLASAVVATAALMPPGGCGEGAPVIACAKRWLKPAHAQLSVSSSIVAREKREWRSARI